MAVPSSGAITMLGIAQERKYGSYGFGTISSPITMFDLLNGGGANAFPSLNTCPQPNTPSYSMSGWYGYNQSASCSTCYEIFLSFGDETFQACNGEFTQYFTSTEPFQPPWMSGAEIYTDPACQIKAQDGYYSNGSEYGFYFRGEWGEMGFCGF